MEEKPNQNPAHTNTNRDTHMHTDTHTQAMDKQTNEHPTTSPVYIIMRNTLQVRNEKRGIGLCEFRSDVPFVSSTSPSTKVLDGSG